MSWIASYVIEPRSDDRDSKHPNETADFNEETTLVDQAPVFVKKIQILFTVTITRSGTSVMV